MDWHRVTVELKCCGTTVCLFQSQFVPPVGHYFHMKDEPDIAYRVVRVDHAFAGGFFNTWWDTTVFVEEEPCTT